MPSVTRKTQANRTERRSDTRHLLMTAVESLLGEGHSFTELSVERIVTQAGISRSTFYVYFEGKGDLLQDLTEGVVEELLTASRAWWEMPPGDSPEQVAERLRPMIDAYRVHQTLMAAVVDAASYDPIIRERFGGMIEHARRGVASHIRAGQQIQRVRPELEPYETAGWLAWMVERGLHELIRSADDDRVDALGAGLGVILWNALYAEAEAAA